MNRQQSEDDSIRQPTELERALDEIQRLTELKDKLAAEAQSLRDGTIEACLVQNRAIDNLIVDCRNLASENALLRQTIRDLELHAEAMLAIARASTPFRRHADEE